MIEKVKIAKGGFDAVIEPNSALCGENIKMPILVQVENNLKISVRVLLKFVTVDDVTTLFVEVTECPAQK